MSSITGASPSGGTTTYRYGIGEITWGDRTLHAFVIDGLPLEGGFLAEGHIASIIANRILAEHLELSDATWAVFVKARPNMSVPEWQFLGAGVGVGPLFGEPLPSSVSAEVINQLERVSLD